MDKNQWIFPVSALQHTPSSMPIAAELRQRALGVQFLFRIGHTLYMFVSFLLLCRCSVALSFVNIAPPQRSSPQLRGSTVSTCGTHLRILSFRCATNPSSTKESLHVISHHIERSSCVHFPCNKDGRMRTEAARCCCSHCRRFQRQKPQ